jgi:putative ABC transport system permease protein
VVLGVATLVFVMGLVQGMFSAWTKRFVENGGLEKIQVIGAMVPEKQRYLVGMVGSTTLNDAEVIKKNCPLAQYISPEVEVQDATVVNGNKHFDGKVKGVTKDHFLMQSFAVTIGRLLGDLDQERESAVAVIGSNVAKELFGSSNNAIHKLIYIKGSPFTVVGVLQRYERISWGYNILGGKNNIVFIPITSAMHRFSSNNKLSRLSVKVTELKFLHQLVDQVEAALYFNHRGVKDTRVFTSESSYESFTSFTKTFNLSASAIAFVSLIVSGIGISNVMLASINERVREIGICKALGAKNMDIFLQFLTESIVLSFLGGMIGFLISVGGIRVWKDLATKFHSTFPIPELSLEIVLIGLGFSVGIGIISGLYPAFKAAKLDPIEAIRHE